VIKDSILEVPPFGEAFAGKAPILSRSVVAHRCKRRANGSHRKPNKEPRLKDRSRDKPVGGGKAEAPRK
jgi:hypothetical protein